MLCLFRGKSVLFFDNKLKLFLISELSINLPAPFPGDAGIWVWKSDTRTDDNPNCLQKVFNANVAFPITIGMVSARWLTDLISEAFTHNRK